MYQVTCAACDLYEEIEGIEDVFDVQEEHESEFTGHVVEFELVREV
ncbi:hypothetical protein [Halobaculum sp. P14]